MVRRFAGWNRVVRNAAVGLVALVGAGAMGQLAAPTRTYPVPGNGQPQAENLPRTKAWLNYSSETTVGDDPALSLLTRSVAPYVFTPDEFPAFPLNFGLLESPLPGDFLPVGTTFASDSMVLVPAGRGHRATSWNGLSRATLHGAVDLVTGVPLAQFTDLSLPFGGAEFRLNRTRSAVRDFTGPSIGHDVRRPAIESSFWDWVGSGWMMSENPILIIDSRGADQVGGREPRCWLWLDAFHSIPFDWVDDGPKTVPAEGTAPEQVIQSGHYDCAPRFRAKLEVRGFQGTTTGRVPQNAGMTESRAGDWAEGRFPSKFIVTMFEGDVVYEFTPVWQDVPQWEYEWEQPVATPRVVKEWSSLHGRPLLPLGVPAADPNVSSALADPTYAPWKCSPIGSQNNSVGKNGRGLGMAYYGLLDTVRDKQGNKAAFQYATVCEFETDLGPTQWTTQKGALREVKLYASGDESPTWTLVYGYRLVPRVGDACVSIADSKPVEGFPLLVNKWKDLSREERITWSDPALESVYVFSGNVETRGITLFRPPEESLWEDGATNPSRWPTDDDDLLARFQSNQSNKIEAWYTSDPIVGGSNDLQNRNDWMFRLRYSYASTDRPNGDYATSTGIKIDSVHAETYQGVNHSPSLVRSELQQRVSPSGPILTLRNHVFQYEGRSHVDSPAEVVWHSRLRWLDSIFDDVGMARIHAEIRASAPATLEQTIEDLASGYEFNGGSAANSLALAEDRTESDFRDSTSVWFGRGSDRFHLSLDSLAEDGSHSRMLPGKMNEYCSDTNLSGRGLGLAKALSIADPETGRRRHYRITRLLHGPDEFSTSGIESGIPGPEIPMRCVFTSPYAWQAYPQKHRYRWATFTDPFAWREPDENSDSHPNTEVGYDKHRWVAIIDEFPTWKDAKTPVQQTFSWGGTDWKSLPQNAMNRRIVAMNPQGNVLWEKTYAMQNGTFAEGGDTGLNETYIYRSGDELLRAMGVNMAQIGGNVATEQYLVERRTVGYAAAPISVHADPNDPNSPPDRKNDGLIYTYKYDLVASNATGLSPGERFRPVSEGIQRGDSYSEAPSGTGEERILRRTYYDATDPNIVLGTAEFTTPPAAGTYMTLPDAIDDSHHIAILSRSKTIREPDNTTGPYTRVEQHTISPGRSIRPNGDLYYDVSISISNEQGQNVWSINAFVKDPDTLATNEDEFARVLLNYNKYGAYGRLEKSWVDVEPGASFVDAADRALLPGQLDRYSPGTAPAQYLTQRMYDWDGLSDIIYPSGKRWARRIVRQIPDEDAPLVNKGKDFDRVYTFNDLVESAGGFRAKSFGSITDYKKYAGPDNVFLRKASDKGTLNEVLQNRQVTFFGVIAIDNLTPQSELPSQELAKAEFGYDSSGRVQNVKLLEHTATGSVAAVADVSDNADRVTTTDLDGTVTRILRNGRGQVTRTYVGTKATDLHNTWDDNNWPENPDPDPLATTNRFDMLLRSRVELGVSANNALLPARQWSYLKQPGWTPAQLAPFGLVPVGEDDEDGERTTTKYDWRMRPVRVEVDGPAAWDSTEQRNMRPRLSTRLTYLDHADRPRLEVSYGEGAKPTLDPSAAAIEYEIPPVESILNHGSATPTSVVETLYNSDGTVKERRTYRLPGGGYTPGGSPQYTAERFGYGPGGKTIFSMQPGSPIRVTTLDNLGRVQSEASVLARGSGSSATYDFELTRTDSFYDSESNVILTERWERLALPGNSSELGSGTPGLNNANAVMQRTETWYDLAKRVLATLEYGSGRDTFSSGSVGAFNFSDHSENPDLAPTLTTSGTIQNPTYTTSHIPAAAGNGGRLTLFEYKDGQKIASLSSSGMLTTFQYDDRGNLHRQIEDATGLKKETTYEQWLGKTISVSGVRLNSETAAGEGAKRQYQGVAYGAQIVAEKSVSDSASPTGSSPTLEYISNSNALVGVMMSVNPDRSPGDGRLNTGAASATNKRDLIMSLDDFEYRKPDFVYRYYADGLIAERVDRRGVSIRYFYDDLRRLREQEVWYYDIAPAPLAAGGYERRENPLTTGQLTIRAVHTPVPPGESGDQLDWAVAKRGYPASIDIPSGSPHAGAPTDRVGYIKYAYDSRGNVERVTAKTGRHAVNVGAIVTDTKYVYDERGNLLREYQAHGVSADSAGVPFILYTRTYTESSEDSAGGDRLVGMTYPDHVGVLGNASGGFAAARNVTFGYGAANMADDASDRIASIAMGSGATSHVASFSYTGSGRRAMLKLGGTSSAPEITQGFDTVNGGGLEGLDRFGRLLDVHYKNAGTTPTTLWRGEYGYDLAGNRTHERLTQRPPSTSVSGTNTRSRLFAYDKLERLLGVKTGALDTLSVEYTVGESDAYPSVRKEAWNLDLMGNWSGKGGVAPPASTDPCLWPTYPGGGGPGDHSDLPPDPDTGGGVGVGAGVWYRTSYGHEVSFNGPRPDGVSEVYERQHPADAPGRTFVPAAPPSEEHPEGIAEYWKDQEPSEWMRNLHANAVRVIQATDPALPRTPEGELPEGAHSYTRHRADPNGNTVFDGEYFYQYDAWNRLVQVNRSGTLSWLRFPYAPDPNGSYAYFAGPGGGGGGGGAQLPPGCMGSDVGELVKHFAYDGVGRLVRTSSPLTVAEGYLFNNFEDGTSTTFTRSERFFYDGMRCVQEVVTDPVVVDLEGNPVASLGSESDQRGGGSGGSGGGSTGEPPMLMSVLRAQYVWGPGDGGGGINGADELLCQLDPRDTTVSSYAAGGGKPYYPLTDAQGDIVALVQVPLVGFESNPPVAEVVGQWTYSPYGEVLSYEQFHPHPAMVYGHKTLRVDRLDGEALTWEYDEEDPGTPIATGLFTETRRLEPGARLVSYARNRTLDIERGRWLQLDPNASGVATSLSSQHHGTGPSPLLIAVQVQPRVADGLNLLAYCNSDPISQSDPHGLFSAAIDAYATMGITAGAMANALVSQYAENQSYDADWAMDWSQPDDWQTRNDNTWIDDIYREADIDGAVNGHPLVMNPVDYGPFASASGAVRLIKIAGKQLVRGFKHHVFPMYLARLVGKESTILTRLPKRLHTKGADAIHKHIDDAIKAISSSAPHMRAAKAKWTEWLGKVGKEKAWEIIQQGVRNGTTTWAKAQQATAEELAQISKVLDEALGVATK